jgi:hypothetical protein
MNHNEYKLQVAVCKFLEMQYPEAIFYSDSISNINLTVPQRVRNKAIQKKNFSCPDLLILEPRNGFHGLALELKKESPYKLNGELKKQVVKVTNKEKKVIEIYDHLQEQECALRTLKSKGYQAHFCWSLDMAVKLINDYMRE